MADLLQPPNDAQDLRPLRESHDDSQLDVEIKAIVMRLIEEMIRPELTRIERMGYPHRGDFALIERFVKRDGLALYRGGFEDAMRHVYQGFLARNQRRGLQFLAFYLQLLFPNRWQMAQQWQDKSQPYPEALADDDGGNHWLTSRIDVQIGSANAQNVLPVLGALRSVVPARILLLVSLSGGDIFEAEAGAAVATVLSGIVFTEGTAE